MGIPRRGQINMTKLIRFFVPISLLLIISYYVFFNTQGYYNIVGFFNKNENELNKLNLIFYSQNKIKYIAHKNFDYCFPLTLVSDNRNSYYIIAFNGERFGIVVDDKFKNEEMFFETGLDNILDTYSKKKISEILNELEFPDSTFLEIIEIMNKIELFAIDIEKNSNNTKYIKNFTDLNEGLLFDPHNSKQEFDSKSYKLKRINPNWFYLYEKNY